MQNEEEEIKLSDLKMCKLVRLVAMEIEKVDFLDDYRSLEKFESKKNLDKLKKQAKNQTYADRRNRSF